VVAPQEIHLSASPVCRTSHNPNAYDFAMRGPHQFSCHIQCKCSIFFSYTDPMAEKPPKGLTKERSEQSKLNIFQPSS